MINEVDFVELGLCVPVSVKISSVGRTEGVNQFSKSVLNAFEQSKT